MRRWFSSKLLRFGGLLISCRRNAIQRLTMGKHMDKFPKSLSRPIPLSQMPLARSITKLPPNAGKGRKPGVPNRLNADLKHMILSALASVGGEAYLIEQAKNNPAVFLALLSKLIPRDVKASVSAEVEISLAERIKRARERVI